MKDLNTLANELEETLHESQALEIPCNTCRKYFTDSDNLLSVYHTGKCLMCEKLSIE